jgi:hypothetical protein
MTTKTASKPRKEALFVQVPVPDDTVEFHDLTRFVGKIMPFASPKATCGMRVSPDTVAFTLLHLTKKTAVSLVGRPVEMPRGPLARLERRALELGDIPAGRVIVEMDDVVADYALERDENGVVELAPNGEDHGFELPKSAVKLAMYFKSPIVGRTLAVGFIGHPGRPGADETLRRVASKALFSLAQLSQFRVLSDIESVTVPMPPRSVNKFVRKAEQKANAVIPVYLYSGDNPPFPVANGEVAVEVDLDSANHATGRLLFHFTPSETIAEHFEAYRPILDSTVGTLLKGHLGDDDVKAITIDIVLGEVGAGTIERLREALGTMSMGLDLTPKMFQLHP